MDTLHSFRMSILKQYNIVMECEDAESIFGPDASRTTDSDMDIEGEVQPTAKDHCV